MMKERGIPWIPIGIAVAMIVAATSAILALQPAPKATPAGAIPIDVNGSEGGLGQLDTSGTGGVTGPGQGGVEGPSQQGIEGPPSLDIDAWHELFQGEIQ